MAEFRHKPQRVHEVLSHTRFVADPTFREELRLQLRDRFTARERTRPFLGRVRAWMFSYPNGYHLREEIDETMNRSKLLTAFSVSILVLALAVFVGLVIVIPSLESPGEAPREASSATQDSPGSDGSSPAPTDDGDQPAGQAIFPLDAAEPVIRTPITIGNVDQLVELAVLDTLRDSGADIAFYPLYPALFMSGHTSGGARQGWGGTLICETNTFQELSRLPHSASLHFSQEGRRVSYGAGKIYIYPPIHNPVQSEGSITLKGHRGDVQDATFNSDDTRVVSGSYDKTLRIWNTQTGEQLLLVEFEYGVTSVAYSPDDALVAAGLNNGEVHLLDAESGDEIAIFEHAASIDHLAFSPDGRLLASASRDTIISLWDLQSLSLSLVLEGHVGQITDLDFNRDGSLLASSGKDATVRLWDPSTGGMLWQYGDSTISATSSQWVVALDFSPDGGLLAFLTGDGIGHVWGLPPGD